MGSIQHPACEIVRIESLLPPFCRARVWLATVVQGMARAGAAGQGEAFAFILLFTCVHYPAHIENVREGFTRLPPLGDSDCSYSSPVRSAHHVDGVAVVSLAAYVDVI